MVTRFSKERLSSETTSPKRHLLHSGTSTSLTAVVTNAPVAVGPYSRTSLDDEEPPPHPASRTLGTLHRQRVTVAFAFTAAISKPSLYIKDYGQIPDRMHGERVLAPSLDDGYRYPTFARN